MDSVSDTKCVATGNGGENKEDECENDEKKRMVGTQRCPLLICVASDI